MFYFRILTPFKYIKQQTPKKNLEYLKIAKQNYTNTFEIYIIALAKKVLKYYFPIIKDSRLLIFPAGIPNIILNLRQK